MASHSAGGRPRAAGFTRRAVIRSAATGAVLAGVGALGACGTGGPVPSTGDDGVDGGQEKTDENPFGVEQGTALDVVVFDGGYGTEYAEAHVEMYNQRWGPGARVTATAKIAATLQPRFADGTPPDVVDNSGPDAMPAARLVADDRLADLGPLLDAPTVDDPDVTIAEVLNPGVAESGEFDGVVRELNYVFSMWGLWHSSSLFEEKGWAPATTMDEFLVLCEDIAADGAMAPFTHSGVHTQYMTQVMCQQAVKHGGRDVLLKLDNLEPDAWTNESMVRVAKVWERVAKEGYIYPAAAEQDHLTSQADWLAGRAAMLPCGSWLENEMKGQIPDGFGMVVQPMPSLTASDAMPYQALGAGASEPFVLPAEAANRAGGFEYLRIMLGREGTRTFADLTGSLCAVKGAGEDLTDPSSALRSVAKASREAGEDMFEIRFMDWYADLKAAVRDATHNLLSGRMTSDQYSSTMQQAVDTVAQDSSVTKFKRV